MLDEEDASFDLSIVPIIKAPEISERCINLARTLMYLTVTGAAVVICTLVILNFQHVSSTLSSVERVASAVDQRRAFYLAKMDNAFEQGDQLVRQTVKLVMEDLLPTITNTTADTRATLDSFLAILKSYSTRGKVTLELPLQ